MHETGEEEMRLVEAEFAKGDASQMLSVPQAELERIAAYFAPPALPSCPPPATSLRPYFRRFRFRPLGENQCGGA